MTESRPFEILQYDPDCKINTKISLNAEFFFPGDHNNRIEGKLEFTPDWGIHISLREPLLKVGTQTEEDFNDPSPKSLSGITEDNRVIIAYLLKRGNSYITHPFKDYRYSAQKVLIGKGRWPSGISSREKLIGAKKITLNMPELSPWIARSMDYSEEEISVKSDLKANFHFSFDGLDCCLKHDTQQLKSPGDEIHLANRISLSMTSPLLVPISELDAESWKLLSLLAILIGTPVHPIQVEFSCEFDCMFNKGIEKKQHDFNAHYRISETVWHHSWFRPSPSFSFKSIEPYFQQIMDIYSKKKEELDGIISLLTSLDYKGREVFDYQFIVTMRGLDHMAGKFYKQETKCSKEELASLRRDLENFSAKFEGENQRELLDSLKRNLEGFNYPSNKVAIKGMIEKLDKKITGRIFFNVQKEVDTMVNLRTPFAHSGNSPDWNKANSICFHQAELLLRVLLLKELGLPNDLLRNYALGFSDRTGLRGWIQDQE